MQAQLSWTGTPILQRSCSLEPWAPASLHSSGAAPGLTFAQKRYSSAGRDGRWSNTRTHATLTRNSDKASAGKGLFCGRLRGDLIETSFQCSCASLSLVQIYDGHFIHYFAPRGLPPVEKNVVFVIDVSGSMFGTKMKQVMSSRVTSETVLVKS